jgi:putative endonuclease
MNYYVYIIEQQQTGKYYIGQAEEVGKRVEQHNDGKSGFTGRIGGKWKLVYQENFSTRSEAIKRELFLKRQRNRSFYKKLIEEYTKSGSSAGYPEHVKPEK